MLRRVSEAVSALAGAGLGEAQAARTRHAMRWRMAPLYVGSGVEFRLWELRLIPPAEGHVPAPLDEREDESAQGDEHEDRAAEDDPEPRPGEREDDGESEPEHHHQAAQ